MVRRIVTANASEALSAIESVMRHEHNECAWSGVAALGAFLATRDELSPEERVRVGKLLSKALTSGDKTTVCDALKSIGHYNVTYTIPNVRRLLGASDLEIRVEAARALDRFGIYDGVDGLVRQAPSYERRGLRLVARSLGGIRRRSVVGWLLHLLLDHDPWVRLCAAISLRESFAGVSKVDFDDVVIRPEEARRRLEAKWYLLKGRSVTTVPERHAVPAQYSLIQDEQGVWLLDDVAPSPVNRVRILAIEGIRVDGGTCDELKELLSGDLGTYVKLCVAKDDGVGIVRLRR